MFSPAIDMASTPFVWTNSPNLVDGQNSFSFTAGANPNGISNSTRFKLRILNTNTNDVDIWLDNIRIVDVTQKQYIADVISTTDYYPFGSVQPGRSYTSDAYRYGFNGMENDNEIKGTSNSLDFGARIYDPRLGRWLAVDPQRSKSPGLTPFRFGFNNPIRYTDPNGKWEQDGHFWTVFAMGVAMGLEIEIARDLALKAEHFDHEVHQDNTMTETPGTGVVADFLRKSGLSHITGAGTWADGGENIKSAGPQQFWHALTGSEQKITREFVFLMLSQYGKTEHSDDVLYFLHTLGDVWAHSYIDPKTGIRMNYGQESGFTSEHASVWKGLDFTYGTTKVDDINGRGLVYKAYLYDLSNVIAMITNTSSEYDPSIFKYVVENGGNKEGNIVLFDNYINWKGKGQTSFDFKDTDSLNLWKGYLEKNNIEYNMVTSYDETSGTYNYNITIK